MYTIKSKKEVVQVVEENQQVSLSQYIGLKLKEAREAKSLKQIDLSRATCPSGSTIPQVSSSSICNIEKGDASPRINTLEALGRVLGVSISYFIPNESN